MENKFCEFLVSIGLIDLKTSKYLKDINNEVVNAKNKHNFSDSFFISLMHYFNNLTLDQKKYICFNLPLRFILKDEKEKKQKLTLIILKKDLKLKYIKLKYLFIWMKNNKINKTEKSSFPNQKETCLSSLSNFKISFDEFMNGKKNKGNRKNKENQEERKTNNSVININKRNKTQKNENKMTIKRINSYNTNYYQKKINDIVNNEEPLTTKDKRELLQLSECTFKPSINNTANNSFLKIPIFDKLYKDSEKYKIKNHIKAMKYEHLMNKEITFKPKLCITPKSISTLKFDSFEIRQQNFLNNRNFNNNKLKKSIESSVEKKCSFSPKINKNIDFTASSSKNNNIPTTKEENKLINTSTNNNNNNCDSYYSISTIKTIPAHVRLYDDSKRRNSSYIQREIEYKKSIDEMANMTSKKVSKIDYDKISNLSENKEKKIIYEKTKKKVEEEEGITFKPEINLNNKYAERIHSNFYERNKIDEKNTIFENYGKFYKENKKDKKYTEVEKKEIIENIVKRLYNESNKQSFLNQKSERNKYINNNNLADANINNIL